MYYNMWRERPDTGFDTSYSGDRRTNKTGLKRIGAGIFVAALGTQIAEFAGGLPLPLHVGYALCMLEAALGVYYGATKLGRRYLSNASKKEGRFYSDLKED